MAVALRAGGVITGRTGITQTVTLSQSTNAFDCVVVVVGNSNTGASSWSPSTASGLGATWSTPYLIPNVGGSTNTNAAVWIGYNCSAGQTTITLNNLPTSSSACTIWGLFSGVRYSSNPVTSTWGTVGPGANGAQVTTASASYNVGDLVLGLAYSFQWATSNASFQVGTALTFASGTGSGFQRMPWGSYVVESTGSSTTYTSATPNLSNGNAVAGIMVLAAGPNVVNLTGTGSVSASGAAAVTQTTIGLVGLGYSGSFNYVTSTTASSAMPTALPVSYTVKIPTGQPIKVGDIVLLDDNASDTLIGTVTSYSTTNLTLNVVSGTNLNAGTIFGFDVFVASGINGSATLKWFNGTGNASVNGSGTLTVSSAISATGSLSANFSSSISAVTQIPLSGNVAAAFTASTTAIVQISTSFALNSNYSATNNSTVVIQTTFPQSSTYSAAAILTAISPQNASISLTSTYFANAILTAISPQNASMSLSSVFASSMSTTVSIPLTFALTANAISNANVNVQYSTTGSAQYSFISTINSAILQNITGVVSSYFSANADLTVVLPFASSYFSTQYIATMANTVFEPIQMNMSAEYLSGASVRVALLPLVASLVALYGTSAVAIVRIIGSIISSSIMQTTIISESDSVATNILGTNGQLTNISNVDELATALAPLTSQLNSISTSIV